MSNIAGRKECKLQCHNLELQPHPVPKPLETGLFQIRNTCGWVALTKPATTGYQTVGYQTVLILPVGWPSSIARPSEMVKYFYCIRAGTVLQTLHKINV